MPSSSNPHPLCHFLYESALWLTLSVFLLIPLHLSAEKHYNIDKIVDSSLVSFRVQDLSFLIPGLSFPVYRFQSVEPSSIGQVTISYYDGKEVFATFDPKKFKWPMGRHGWVMEAAGSMVKVSLGYGLGLRQGDLLCLFQDRQMVGRLRLQEVHPDHSWGSIVYLNPGIQAEGLTVSEYTVATQVVILQNPYVGLFELLLIVFVFGLHSSLFIFKKKSLLAYLGESLRSLFKPEFFKKFYFIFHIVLGVPFIWFMVNFFPRCFFYVGQVLVGMMNSFFHLSIRLPDGNGFLNQNMTSLYIVAGGVYLVLMIWKNTSPIALFWQWSGFRAKESKIFKGFWRDALIWGLHLIIFYAFGRTLVGFLQGNLNAAFHIIWPNTRIVWYQFGLFNQLPIAHTMTMQEWFLVIRYFLWSVTIVGCLFGYGYSVFCYLWGKRIRNLDFTAMGWITNAVCYGPLLGGVVFQLTPSLMGLDPIVTQGPLLQLNMITETMLNLVYTLSIWNLGTMFGVMTDKGVRTSGFYSVVRHPSYTLEGFMFAMMYLNGLTTHSQWLAMLNICLFTYYVRSEREDQFMSRSNPEYIKYQQRTMYKFIPGVF